MEAEAWACAPLGETHVYREVASLLLFKGKKSMAVSTAGEEQSCMSFHASPLYSIYTCVCVVLGLEPAALCTHLRYSPSTIELQLPALQTLFKI